MFFLGLISYVFHEYMNYKKTTCIKFTKNYLTIKQNTINKQTTVIQILQAHIFMVTEIFIMD